MTDTRQKWREPEIKAVGELQIRKGLQHQLSEDDPDVVRLAARLGRPPSAVKIRAVQLRAYATGRRFRFTKADQRVMDALLRRRDEPVSGRRADQNR